MSNKKILLKSALIIFMGTLLSKILGFVRDMLIAQKFGASFITDAYNIAMTVPNVLFSGLYYTITNTFIPIFVEEKNKGQKKQELYYANNIINIMLVVSGILVGLAIIFSPYIVKIFAPGFKGQTYELAKQLISIMFPMVIFYCLAGIFQSMLYAYGEFTIPSLMGIPYNIIIIFGILFSYKEYGIVGIAVFTVIGSAFQFLIQLPRAKEFGYRYQPVFDLKNKVIQKNFSLIVPIFIANSASQINTIVDKSIASTLNAGSISVLHYANRVYLLPVELIVVALADAFYPSFAEYVESQNYDELRDIYVLALKAVIFIFMPMTVLFMVLSTPIIQIIFKRGQFGDTATINTSIALALYSVGMLGTAIRRIVNRMYFSFKDTKTPMYAGFITISSNIIMDFTFVRFMGFGGLALATSISINVGTILLCYWLSKKRGIRGGKELYIFIFKISIATLFMGVACKFGYDILSSYIITSTNFIAIILKLVITVLLSAVIYILAANVLGLKKLSKFLLDTVRNRITNGR